MTDNQSIAQRLRDIADELDSSSEGSEESEEVAPTPIKASSDTSKKDRAMSAMSKYLTK